MGLPSFEVRESSECDENQRVKGLSWFSTLPTRFPLLFLLLSICLMSGKRFTKEIICSPLSSSSAQQMLTHQLVEFPAKMTFLKRRQLNSKLLYFTHLFRQIKRRKQEHGRQIVVKSEIRFWRTALNTMMLNSIITMKPPFLLLISSLPTPVAKSVIPLPSNKTKIVLKVVLPKQYNCGSK